MMRTETIREHARTLRCTYIRDNIDAFLEEALTEGYAIDEALEVLFNLLSNRNQKGSMVITTNLAFNRWNEVFNDEVLTGAIVDRIAYKAHVVDMTGESYRVLETEAWIKQAQKEAA